MAGVPFDPMIADAKPCRQAGAGVPAYLSFGRDMIEMIASSLRFVYDRLPGGPPVIGRRAVRRGDSGTVGARTMKWRPIFWLLCAPVLFGHPAQLRMQFRPQSRART